MPFTIGEVPIGNVVDGELVLRDVEISSYDSAPIASVPSVKAPAKRPAPQRGGAGGLLNQSSKLPPTLPKEIIQPSLPIAVQQPASPPPPAYSCRQPDSTELNNSLNQFYNSAMMWASTLRFQVNRDTSSIEPNIRESANTLVEKLYGPNCDPSLKNQITENYVNQAMSKVRTEVAKFPQIYYAR